MTIKPCLNLASGTLLLTYFIQHNLQACLLAAISLLTNLKTEKSDFGQYALLGESAYMTGADDQNLTSLEKLCVEKNMRMTDQRRIIARVLSLAKDHPSVEDVHQRAHEIDAGISLSTVYRTVRLFVDAGIVESHDFGDGKARLETVAEEHHDHLINVKTGEVIEFRNEEIEALQERVARELGFKLVDHRLELYGVPLDQDEKK